MAKNGQYRGDFWTIAEFRISDTSDYIPLFCCKTNGHTLKYENESDTVCNAGIETKADKISEIKTTILAIRNKILLEKLFGAETTLIPGPTHTLVEEEYTFSSEGYLELPYKSNDGLGVTTIVIKSQDGATTYDPVTDYSVEFVKSIGAGEDYEVEVQRTIIRVLPGGAMSNLETVKIDGTVNVNPANKQEIKHGTTILPKFDVRFVGFPSRDGQDFKYELSCTKGKLSAEYQTSFLDRLKSGDIEGTELTWTFEDGKTVIIDELSAYEDNN